MLEGDGESNENFDDLRNGMELEGGQYSVRFDIAVKRELCAVLHSREECKCGSKVSYKGRTKASTRRTHGKLNA